MSEEQGAIDALKRCMALFAIIEVCDEFGICNCEVDSLG